MCRQLRADKRCPLRSVKGYKLEGDRQAFFQRELFSEQVLD
jgi:hypothetical protein